MNIDHLSITHVYEGTIRDIIFLIFKIDDIKYDLSFFETPGSNKISIFTIDHGEDRCGFCQSEVKSHNQCDVLTEHAEEIFRHLNRFSKDRLRRFGKNIAKRW